ncbi:hypothetical protein ACHQM5_009336 [Ranunculus cassubicifolius]
MAQIHKLHVEADIKSPADKFYGMFRNSMSDFPKAYPEMYKSIDLLAGDGKTVGSIILLKYSTGSGAVSVAKDRIVAVDEKERSITYEVIEGDLLAIYNSFVLKIQVTEEVVNKSVVKWSVEYEKRSEDVPEPDFLMLLAKTKKLDTYLLKEH